MVRLNRADVKRLVNDALSISATFPTGLDDFFERVAGRATAKRRGARRADAGTNIVRIVIGGPKVGREVFFYWLLSKLSSFPSVRVADYMIGTGDAFSFGNNIGRYGGDVLRDHIFELFIPDETFDADGLAAEIKGYVEQLFGETHGGRIPIVAIHPLEGIANKCNKKFVDGLFKTLRTMVLPTSVIIIVSAPAPKDLELDAEGIFVVKPIERNSIQEYAAYLAQILRVHFETGKGARLSNKFGEDFGRAESELDKQGVLSKYLNDYKVEIRAKIEMTGFPPTSNASFYFYSIGATHYIANWHKPEECCSVDGITPAIERGTAYGYSFISWGSGVIRRLLGVGEPQPRAVFRREDA